MARFENRTVEQLTFFQWINMEHALVKRQYKSELTDVQKASLKSEYKKYLKETE